jgi:glycosyltransferase involved in cell wall biosynthesis
MMRIAFVTTGLQPHGAELALLRLAAGLKASGCEPVVLSMGAGEALAPSFRDQGVEVHSMRMRRAGSGASGLVRLVRLLRQIRPQLVHGWMVHGNVAATLAAPVTGLPLVWGIRHSALSSADKRLTRALDRCLAYFSALPYAIIYNSQAGRSAHEALGYSRIRGVVVPNGIDTNAMRPMPERRAGMRAALGIAQSALVVVCMARFHPMKDHLTLLRTMALLRRARREVHLVLAGQGVTAQNVQLRVWARELGLEGRLHCLGHRADVAELMSAADACICCSAWGEGFSNSVAEAMSCAVPCVVTDVGDCRRIVGDTGFTVPVRDPVSAAEALEKVLYEEPTAGVKRREAARTRILQLYGVGQMVSRHMSVYAEAARPERVEPPVR